MKTLKGDGWEVFDASAAFRSPNTIEWNFEHNGWNTSRVFGCGDTEEMAKRELQEGLRALAKAAIEAADRLAES